jgi:hypothetical protein
MLRTHRGHFLDRHTHTTHSRSVYNKINLFINRKYGVHVIFATALYRSNLVFQCHALYRVTTGLSILIHLTYIPLVEKRENREKRSRKTNRIFFRWYLMAGNEGE